MIGLDGWWFIHNGERTIQFRIMTMEECTERQLQGLENGCISDQWEKLLWIENYFTDGLKNIDEGPHHVEAYVTELTNFANVGTKKNEIWTNVDESWASYGKSNTKIEIYAKKWVRLVQFFSSLTQFGYITL